MALATLPCLLQSLSKALLDHHYLAGLQLTNALELLAHAIVLQHFRCHLYAFQGEISDPEGMKCFVRKRLLFQLAS